MTGMKRGDRAIPNEQTLRILNEGLYGVLAAFDGQSAYGVPMNYVHAGGNLYMHGAAEGHKIDAVRHCPNVCFTVVGHAKTLPDELTMDYSSVIALGRASIVEDDRERGEAMRMLCKKYAPGSEERVEAALGKDIPNLAVIKIAIEHICGKGTIHT